MKFPPVIHSLVVINIGLTGFRLANKDAGHEVGGGYTIGVIKNHIDVSTAIPLSTS